MFDDEKEISVKDLPIYRKGKEIFDVVHHIGSIIPEDDDHLQMIKGNILVDAGLLSVKIAGTSRAELYDLKMEAAAIIRKAARDIILYSHSLEMFGFKDVKYFEVVRELVEEYRLLFIEWVAGFNKWNYIIDRWGLFNPPGISPFDKDPDDDIPNSSDDEDY